jgi:hypothetical protein
MPSVKKATTRPKRKVVSPAETRTQLRLTVDSKFTKSHFSQLFAVLKIRRKNALAEHIIMNFKTKGLRRTWSRSTTARGWIFHFRALTPRSYSH